MQNSRKEDNLIKAYVELEKDLRSCMRCKFFYGSNRQCLAKKCVKEERKREITEQERENECFGCPLQSLEELRKLRKHFPELWEQLREWNKRNFRSFRADYAVEQMEIRFQFEEECARMGKAV